MQELGDEEGHEGEHAQAVPARAPASGVHARADHREERQVPHHRVVVQLGGDGEHGQADGGQQRGRDRLPAHGGVGDGEQGEQRGETAGDRTGEGVSREPAHHDGEPDAEDGPRGETQPRPPRVRRHEHPLQHCYPSREES